MTRYCNKSISFFPGNSEGSFVLFCSVLFLRGEEQDGGRSRPVEKKKGREGGGERSSVFLLRMT